MDRYSRVSGRRALGAGAVATIGMVLFLTMSAPAAGLGQVDYPAIVGSAMARMANEPSGPEWLAAGWGVFLLAGVLTGQLYAAMFFGRLIGPPWLQGLIFGGAMFLASSMVFFPILDALASVARFGNGRAAGLWGVGFIGGNGVAANLMGHGVFGILLGVMCQPSRRFGRVCEHVMV